MLIMAAYTYIHLLLRILFYVLIFVLFLAILAYQRRKRQKVSRQRLEIIDLLAKWRDKHWPLTSLGKPNTREIIQYGPPSEGIIVLGKPHRPDDTDVTFTPVFAAYTKNCQETLLAFSEKKQVRGSLDPDTISTYLFAIDEPPYVQKDFQKREAYLNDLFHRCFDE
jgi:hypothetical protein